MRYPHGTRRDVEHGIEKIAKYLNPHLGAGCTIREDHYAGIIDQTLSAHGRHVMYLVARRLRVSPEYRYPFGKVRNQPWWKLAGDNERGFAQKKWSGHVACREGDDHSATLYVPYVENPQEQEQRIIEAVANKR